MFGYHGYDTTGNDLVLKWDGHKWTTLPWSTGIPALGGLGWGVRQNNDRLWALSVEPQFTSYRLTGPIVAALDDGEVYVNVYHIKCYILHGRLKAERPDSL